MAHIAKAIDVNVPVRTAYNQWTQFEEFPRFMEGVEEVRQLDDRRLHWRAKIAGRTEEWEAEIREQVPDQKVIWMATSGKENAGIVTFQPIGEAATRVSLEMSYDAEGFVEKAGDALGFASRRVSGDLQRFKEYIESRGQESGEWRGGLQNANVPGGHTRGVSARARAAGESQAVRGDIPPRPGQMDQGGMGGDDPERSRQAGDGGNALAPGAQSREPGQHQPPGALQDPAGYRNRDQVIDP